MDFEAVNWDVESAAKELDRSLFQDSKKKKKKSSRKRKPEAEIQSQNSVVNKKKKANYEGKVKQTENILEKMGEQKTDEVSNANANEPMSRKEKRNKKWQEKILKRKLMNEKNTGTSLNKAETGSKVLISQTVKTEKNMQPGQNSEMQTKTKSSETRSEKRKLKWEQIQTRKKQRLEKKKSDNLEVSEMQLEAQNKPDKVSKDGYKKKTSNKNVIVTKVEGQMNRKERKKLQWKEKLKERKQSQKITLEDKSEASEVFGQDRNNESVDLPVINKENLKKTMNLKNEKKRKVGQNSQKTLKETVKTEVRQVEGSTVKEEPTSKRENADAETSEVKHKKKRKRICKRNKFKGYVKPNLGVTEDSSDRELANTVSTDKNVKEVAKHMDTSLSEMSDLANDSIVSKKKKHKEKHKSTSSVCSTVNETKPNSGGKPLEKKGSKSMALDPKKLKALLSDKSPNLSMEKKKDKKPKSLLEKSKERLNAARFRYLNEQLYTTTGQEALKMFKNDEVAFTVYHEGFQGQVEKWPTNPIDVIIEKLRAKPKNLILADFGCGDAKLARSVQNTVHSFDLVALNDHVTVCDMSKVPIKDGIVDIAVFCLSLMGTNLTSYLQEANRVIKHNGTLMIAEVTSRFGNIRSFITDVEKMGFRLKLQDNANKMFVMMEFKKTAKIKDGHSGDIQLKPCLYKKR